MLTNKRGQALIEALISLPLLAAFVASLLWFIYWSSYKEIIHHALFRASRCEASIDATRCYQKLKRKVDQADLFSNSTIKQSKLKGTFSVKTKISNHILIQKLKEKK